LFGFDDLLDLSLLYHILCLFIVDSFYLFVYLYFDFGFQFSELLSLLSDVLMHSQLHFIEVLLIDFTSLPHGQTLLGFGLSFALLDVHSSGELDLLTVHKSLLKVVTDCHVN
jgi:hypothetical protein